METSYCLVYNVQNIPNFFPTFAVRFDSVSRQEEMSS